MLTAERLNEILAQGLASGTMTWAEAEVLCAEYPYFQVAQLFRAALTIEQTGNREGATNAALVSDRLSLYSAVYGAPCGYEEFAAEQQTELIGEQEESLRETAATEVHDGAWDFSTTVETEAAQEEFAWSAQSESAGETDVARDEEEPEVAEEAGSVECIETVEETHEAETIRETEELRAAEYSAAEVVEAEVVEAGSEETLRHEQREDEVSLAQEIEVEEGAEAAGEKRVETVADEPAVAPESQKEKREREQEASSSEEIPTIDLHGVLEQALSQEVPDMSPSISLCGAVGFSLTRQDIDYINTHLNPRSAEASVDGLESAGESEAESQARRIDSFIENFDNILSKVLEEERAEAAEGREPDDLAESQGHLDVHIASERLAFLLAEKGEYDVAIQMYERLGAQNPKKSSYFAEIIERLRERKEGNK